RGGGQGGGGRDPALPPAGQRRRHGGLAGEVAGQAGGARQARGDAGKEIGARVTATDDLHALHDCDLVLESVVEDLAVKKELFTRLDDIVKPEGIIATNTSTLPVVELAMDTERPSQVVG